MWSSWVFGSSRFPIVQVAPLKRAIPKRTTTKGESGFQRTPSPSKDFQGPKHFHGLPSTSRLRDHQCRPQYHPDWVQGWESNRAPIGSIGPKNPKKSKNPGFNNY